MDELEWCLGEDDLDVPAVGARPPGADVIDRIVVRQRAINAAEAEQLVDMLDVVEAARAEGATFSPGSAKTAAQAAVHDLSLALSVAPGVVSRRLAVARRTRGRLPAVWRSQLAGSITSWHAMVIDQQVQRLTRPDSPGLLDERIADYACEHTPTQTRRWLARQVERLEADASLARHRKAREERHVRVTDAGDGMAWLNALLPAIDAHAIVQRLDTETRQRVRTGSDARTHDQACADLLSGLLLGSPATEDEGQRTPNGVKTVIGITVPVTTLLGLDDQPGELADGSASVPADIVRGKALEPGTVFYRLLTDEHGHLLDATHLGRFAPEKIRTALWFRDATTTFPTSTVAADRCDIDHAQAWPAPTRGDNLAPVHRRAHRLKTAGHYSVRRKGRGWEWTTGTGHVYRRDPDPLPVESWPEPVIATTT